MQGIETGSDGAIGDIGDRASRIALGKVIQQMIVALDGVGGRDGDALSRVLRIVLGDGVKWNGVMQELERLGETVKNLTDKMIALEEKLTNKVATLEKTVNSLQSDMHDRKETSQKMLWMLSAVLTLVIAIAVVYIWQAVI